MKFSRRRGEAPRSDAGTNAAAEAQAQAQAAQPTFGPYDIAQAPPDDRPRLDLGAVQLPVVAGVEIQLQAGPQGQIQQVMLAHETSRLQLAVFAAPRTEGIWDEVRTETVTTLAANGGKPTEVTGQYGAEIRGQLREAGGGVVDVRHVGIDGPRWFVRAIFLGAAAIDPERAGPLRDVLQGLVVDRGAEARPVGEALPMRLPPEAEAQLAEQTGEQTGEQT